MIKKVLKINIICLMIFLYTYDMAYASSPDIPSESAVVIDQRTDRILYAKNIDEEKAMASTTKIMTAIVAIENGDLDDIVTISENAAGIEGSSIYLEEGEQLTLEELLYGLMLRSGNDAAYAIGEHIGGGNIENFIDMMNRKAKEVNANNTHFTNPHGLDHEKHYTTARDLAKITSNAMENETFKKIVSTKKITISWPNHEWNRSLQNKNKMLWNYNGGNGVKTGYTSKAGKCLVSSALQNDMQLISVVLKANDIWKESSDILDYSFEKYNPYTIVKKDDYLRSISVENGGKDRIKTYSSKDIIIPVSEGELDELDVRIDLPRKIEAPVIKEQIIGKLEIFIHGEKIDSTDIYVKENIEHKSSKNMFKKFMYYWME